MDALILADGDAPDARRARRAPGRAGTRRSAWSSPPTAARGYADRLGVAIDLWVGDGDSLGRGRARRARGRGRPDRAVAPRQGRIGHRAGGRGRAPAGADGIVDRRRPRRPADRSCPRQRRAAGHARARRPARRSCSTARSRIPSSARPGADGAPVRTAARRAHRRHRVAPADGRRRRGRHDRRPRATRSPTSRCRRAGARPVERPDRRRRGGRPSGAACCSSWSPLLRSDHEHASRRRRRSRGRPARRDRDHPSPVRPARPLDDPLLLPDGRHARLHGRGVRVPRQQRRRSTSAARTSGASARRAPPASAPSARSSGCRSRSWPTRATRSPRRTARGSRRRTTARRTGARRATTFLVDPDGRIARVWPKVKPEGHAAEVLAALDELQAAARLVTRIEASLGGRRAKPRRQRTPVARAIRIRDRRLAPR